MNHYLLCFMLWLGLVGCTSDRLPAGKHRADLRLKHLTQTDLEALIQKQEVVVLIGGRGAKSFLPVGNRTTVGELLENEVGRFAHDWQAMLVQRDAVLQRPGWYAAEEAEQRCRFMGTTLQAGDVIILRPDRW